MSCNISCKTNTECYFLFFTLFSKAKILFGFFFFFNLMKTGTKVGLA